jgi:uncharacterized protein (TIGR02996 family)
MTTEDDFQAMLDLHPDDHQTRLIFADWLDERGDSRGPGYRALGRLGRWPFYYGSGGRDGRAIRVTSHGCPYWLARQNIFRGNEPHALPEDWFALLVLHAAYFSDGSCAPAWFKNKTTTRRQCEDAAAEAFTRLPAYRQDQLLSSPTLTTCNATP